MHFRLDSALPNFSDEIAKKLPPMGKSVPRWKRQLADNCQVFNIELWNASFPKWPVVRLPVMAEKKNVRRDA